MPDGEVDNIYVTDVGERLIILNAGSTPSNARLRPASDDECGPWYPLDP